MEKELFHENLEMLYAHFGRDTVFVPLKQAAAFLRKDPRTLQADKTFPIKRIGKGKRVTNNVPLVSFARWLS